MRSEIQARTKPRRGRPDWSGSWTRSRAVGRISRSRRVDAALWRIGTVIAPRLTAFAMIAICATTVVTAQHALSTRDFFYVGGSYAGEGSTEVMAGQMYVEV